MPLYKRAWIHFRLRSCTGRFKSQAQQVKFQRTWGRPPRELQIPEFSWSVVQAILYNFGICLTPPQEAGPFRKVATDHAVEMFIPSSLPRTVHLDKVDSNCPFPCDWSMPGKLHPTVHGKGCHHLAAQSIKNHRGSLITWLYQTTLIPPTNDRITFQTSQTNASVSLRQPFGDHQTIDKFPTIISTSATLPPPFLLTR